MNCPLAFQDQWVTTIRNAVPYKYKPSPRDIMNFLDFAVDLHEQYPGGSVLKYATRTLANSKKFNKNSADFFLKYLIALAVFSHDQVSFLYSVRYQRNIT